MSRGEGIGGSQEKSLEMENPDRRKNPTGALPTLSRLPSRSTLVLFLLPTLLLLLLTVLTCLSLWRASAALEGLEGSRTRSGNGRSEAGNNLSGIQQGMVQQFEALQGLILNVSREVQELQGRISRNPEVEKELSELRERLGVLESRESPLVPLREQLEQVLEETRNLSRMLCPRCPSGWEQFSRTCYFFSSSTKSWWDSRDFCSQFQAHLAVVDSEQENLLWLGLSDELQEGSWTWVSGGSSGLWFWDRGEPNDSGGSEDCAGIYPGGLWNDLPCPSLQRWVCERPC